MVFSSLLAFWLVAAGFAGEIRQAPALPSLPAPIASLTPLDVRDAAMPFVAYHPELPSQVAPQLSVASPQLSLVLPQAQFAGAGPSALQSSPLAQALARPGADAKPAIQELLDFQASRVALLDGPMESIDARANMIDDAKETVFAAYYRFHMDAAGFSKLSMLRKAARRGRDVRLVLDPWGSGIPRAMLKHLVDSGVKIRFYHKPTFSRPSWLWHRSHDKWTIVDGKTAVFGDRNIGKHYFGMGDSPWTSREVLVEGAAAKQSDDYARAMWNSAEVSEPRGLEEAGTAQVQHWSERLDAFEEHFERRKASGESGLKPWTARTRTISGARFSHNPFGPKRGLSGTGLDLLRMIRRAEKTIVIENSYIVLPNIFQKELERAIKRGVRVVMLTNSLETNNLFSAKTAYEADVPMLIKMGVELWEFKGPGTLHAKAMVIDGTKSYLGSFNLDPRSLRLNTETGLIADDAYLARDILYQFRQTQENSTLVGFEGKMLVPRRMLPILGKVWAVWRSILLWLFRDQV